MGCACWACGACSFPVEQGVEVVRIKSSTHPFGESGGPVRHRGILVAPLEVAEVVDEAARADHQHPFVAQSGQGAADLEMMRRRRAADRPTAVPPGYRPAGYIRRSGTQTPWSMPWFGLQAGGMSPASARCRAMSGGEVRVSLAPDSGFGTAASGKPPKSCTVAGCVAAPTLGMAAMKWAEATTIARGRGKASPEPIQEAAGRRVLRPQASASRATGRGWASVRVSMRCTMARRHGDAKLRPAIRCVAQSPCVPDTGGWAAG